MGKIIKSFGKISYSPKRYEQGGSLESWYIKRLENIGTTWCVKFAYELKKYVTNDNLFFVSPSANKGTYEKAIFNQLVNNDLYCVKMVISDHAQIMNKAEEEIVKNSLGTSSFIDKGKYDAKELTEIVNDCDVIFDMKGAIWHEKKLSDFETLIKTYHRVLCEDGLLIIDCTPETKLNIFLNEIAYIFNKNHLRTERSTLQILEQKPLKSKIFRYYFEPIGQIQTEQICFNVYTKKKIRIQ